jgi:peptidoglycan/xylan/chitin deacetylase (PgdA/CDA1 family)
MGLRFRLARTLDRAGALSLVLRARRLAGPPWLTVLTWHRVATPDSDAPFDQATIDATPAEFDWQLAMVKRHCQVVSLADVEAHLHGGPLPKNPVLLTFDDGYLDCHTHALPLLEKHRLSAVFFIATHYLGERRLFWWDRVARAIRRTGLTRITVGTKAALSVAIGGDREQAKAEVLGFIKRTVGLDVDAFVRELEIAAAVPLSDGEERALADQVLMTWDQVRDLRRRGMEVGSHTRTHRVLQTIASPKDLGDELAGSRAELEAVLGEPVRAIAYPVGPSVMDRPDIVEAVGRAGYTMGFTNKTGINVARRPHRFDLRRLYTDRGMEPAVFRATLAVPHFQ